MKEKDKVLTYPWVILEKTGSIAVQPQTGGPIALNNKGLVDIHTRLWGEYRKAEHYLNVLLKVVKDRKLEEEIRRELELPVDVEGADEEGVLEELGIEI